MDFVLHAPLRTRKGPAGRRFSDEARNQEWIRLFRSGVTTVEIGERYGVNGSSVARILRSYGIARSEGGKEVAAEQRRCAAAAARRIAYFASLDCKESEFRSEAQFFIALRRYRQQRRRALDRAIGWQLTFGEWWRIWTESGRWNARGRSDSDSAVMARFGDEGPYRKGNVYITTLAVNFSESHHVRGHVAKLFLRHGSSVLLHAQI